MKDFITLLKINHTYVSRLFEAREKYFEESFKTSLFPDEPTAFEVFMHAITALYRLSKRLVGEPPENFPDMALDPQLPLHKQLLQAYDVAITTFNDAITAFSKEDLDKPFSGPHPEFVSTLREWLAFITMHTLGHVSQALRLQAIYIRHKMEEP